MPENTYIPEWVPSLWHDTFKKYWGNVPKEKLPTDDAGIRSFHTALKALHDNETGFEGSLHTLREGKGTITPKFVERVFDPNNKYDYAWQNALIQHPGFDAAIPSPDFLKQVVHNPEINIGARHKAFFKDPRTDYTPPADVLKELADVSSAMPDGATEDKLIQIINSSKEHDYATKNYIYSSAKNLEDNSGYSGLNLSPKLESVLADHPQTDLLSTMIPQKFASEDNFDKYLARLTKLEPSEDDRVPPETDAANRLWFMSNQGHGLTPAQRAKIVNRSLEMQEALPQESSYHNDINRGTHRDIQSQSVGRGLPDDLIVKLYKDPKFLDHDENDSFRDIKNKPEVLAQIADHYLDMQETLAGHSYNVSMKLADKIEDPKVIERIFNKYSDQISVTGRLIQNRHADENVVRGIYSKMLNSYDKEKAAMGYVDSRTQDFLGRVFYAKNLPKDIAEEMVRNNFNPRWAYNGVSMSEAKNPLSEHAEVAIVNGLASGEYTAGNKYKEGREVDREGNQIAKRIAKTSKNQDHIRKIHEYFRGENHDEDDFLWDNQDPFAANPNTPADVLVERSDLYREPKALVQHQNFPTETLEHWANLEHDLYQTPEGKSKQEPTGNFYRKEHARKALSYINPDKYKKPYMKDFSNPEEDYGEVQVKPNAAKLRALRDKITELDPTKGEIVPKVAGQGPFDGGWKPLQEKNGNISAKKIQEFIDNQPSTKYRYEHSLWDGGIQTHARHPQRVFQLNVTTDLVRKLKEAGVYDTFRNISSNSEDSGHPVEGGHTIGWVRYEHHSKGLKDDSDEKNHWQTASGKPHAIHIDEIQTDMGPNTIKRLKEYPDRARERGVDPDKLQIVHDIVFDKKNPSEVLLDAFRQYHRNLGRHDVEIHMLDSKTKAPISGQNVKEALPVHMKNTYTDIPKKLGFKPAKYGATDQQDNKKIVGQPTWTDKIRKFEEEAISKAISKIKPGKQLSELDYDSDMINNMPEHYRGKLFSFDYNHLLSPELKRSGYRLYVNHIPEHHIMAELFHKKQSIGQIGTRINFLNPNMLEIHNAAIGDDDKNPQHRSKGLGTAMYEAVLAHAYHNGITHVSGQDHSTMAHNVHKRLAEKHGLEYKAKKNFSQSQVAPGPYDDKYQGYQYMIKSEAVPPTSSTPSEAGYAYHATNAERAHGIAQSGLGVHNPGDFTDQETWPDGSVDKRNYFSPHAHAVWAFAPEEGPHVILRTHTTKHPFQQEGTGDLYSTKPVHPDNLEILTHTGWTPIKNWSSPLGKGEDLDKAVLDPNAGYTISHEEKVEPPTVSRTRGEIPETKYIKVFAHHGGKVVGCVHLCGIRPDHTEITAFNTDVEPAHQRKGLASAMYAHAEKVTGLKMKPSSTQSPAGRMLWEGNENNPQFGKDRLGKGEDLDKAQKPEDFKSIVRATNQEGKNTVDDSAEHMAHPPAIASSADSYRTTIQQTPQAQKRQVGKASSGITKKVLYQNSPSEPKFMVKPYHEGIVRRIANWQKFPIQGWAEMTNQALYHSAGMGDLHQKVHVSHHDMGTGTPEPALVVELANGYKPSSEWQPIGEDTGKIGGWDYTFEPGEIRGAHTYGEKFTGDDGLPRYKMANHIHKRIVPDHESIRKIGLMDFLTNNLDRHHGNIMYDKAGKPLAIDHSRSFQYVNSSPFKHLNPTQVKRRADFSDEFGNYIHPTYSAVGAHEGSRLGSRNYQDHEQNMANWSPIINEWWPKNRDNVVNTMEQRLSQIKDLNVKNHIRRNFMERVGWLDERAELGLENFGLENWHNSPVQQHLPHQKSDWENDDGTGVRWDTKRNK